MVKINVMQINVLQINVVKIVWYLMQLIVDHNQLLSLRANGFFISMLGLYIQTHT